jgi:hypothetical protein
MALLPALPAAADDDVSALTVAAQEARAAADAAHDTADAAVATADDASAQADALRAAADAASAANTAAADALALDPENVDLIAAAEAAQLAFDAADGLATDAEAAAAEANAAADAALADAAALEDAALAAEAALAAATGPPEEEVTPPTDDESLVQSSKFNSCEQDLSVFAQDTAKWNWCFPDPEIDIDVENICPTEIVVHISHLWWWVDYTVLVNGVEYPITIDQWGKATFTVTDFTDGKFEVKIYKGDKKIAYEHEWIKSDCPWISTDVEHECRVIDGTAEVEVALHDLQWWRSYDVTITGPNGYSYTNTISWQGYWEHDFDLEPGSYVVSVESPGWRHVPHLGPVVYEFTVDPCPGQVTITIVPTCATSGSGSLGASLSGLVPGREYHVTVVGPNGTVTDVTFVAAAPTWPVPPANLPPGTYTVTVVDTESSDGGYMMLDYKQVEHQYDPLTWTATGTISPCPALAHTGTGPSTELVPGLALIPIGAGLLVASAMRSRRRMVDLVEEDS